MCAGARVICRGLRYGSNNGSEEYSSESESQHRVRCVRPLTLIVSQACKTMTEKRRRSSLEQQWEFRVGEFCERGNKVPAEGTVCDCFIAGKLAIQSEARANDPDEWMKPENAKAHFMNQPD